MENSTLKKSFWGYSKLSVSEYIARINQEFSQKLLDVVAEHEREKKDLQEKLAQLERENRALQEQQDEVAAILLDTRAYAARLNDRAEAEDRRLRAENMARSTAERDRVRGYRVRIDTIRGEIRELVETMDAELERKSGQLSALEEGVQGDGTQTSCGAAAGEAPGSVRTA